MEEEKYAYIKLISGEEIFAQVEEFVDEDKCLVAFDPCFIKELPVKRGPFALYRVEPWLKLSDERMFAFDLKNVLYYGRCKDKEKISTFIRNQNSLNKGTTPPESQVGISSSLGFVSSVKNTRESLEKLFNIEKDT